LVDDWLAQLVALIASLLGVAFFASIETALNGVPESRVRAAVDRGMRNARHLGFWLQAPGWVLATTGLLRVTGVVGAGVAAANLTRASNHSPPDVLLVAVVAVGVLFLSHLLPRIAAKRHPLEWALSTIRVVRVLAYAFAPVTWPLLATTRALARWTGVEVNSTGNVVFWTPDEVDRVAEEARTDTLDGAGEDLYRSIIDFSDTIVGEIMVPRTDMVVVAVGTSGEEVRRRAKSSGHSRIPVYEDTVDHIIGLLYVKDLSAPGRQDPLDLRAAARPTFYVPEVMKISELLREFQRRKTHMAIVVDEYGGTAGLVTLEDIIEEIVGEIQDEHDVEEKQFRVIGENRILADGRISVWELEEPLGVDFPEEGGYESLAGFVTARAGFLPTPGTVITWQNLLFTIKEANEKRIGTVEIEVRPPADPR
jgi:CBS domain containing-hemolysin-like protein